MPDARVLGDLMRPFVDELARLRPDGAEAIDIHTHLGLDEDGRSLDTETLLHYLDEAGVARAVVFPLHDPERRPAYRVPNDRVLAWAGESGGRLVPFCRLDPADDPVAEGERALSRGARGIKLHPRAQAFSFAGGAADSIFALASEARVPILIHAGAGMPPMAADLSEVALRHPEVPLVLAHAGVADQGIFASRLAEHPAVFYDTSWFSAFDLVTLLSRVPAERVVFASDPPYGRPLTGLYLLLRVAALTGLADDVVRGLVGGNAAALLDGGPLPEPSPPRASDSFVTSAALLRVTAYCRMVFTAMFAGNQDIARGMLDLALAACREPADGPAAAPLARARAALEGASSLIGAVDPPWLVLGPVFMAMAVTSTERVDGDRL